MKNIKVKTYLLQSKKNANDESPVYIRVNFEGRAINLSTGIFIRCEFWDLKKKMIKSKHPDAVRLNHKLTDSKSKINNIHFDLERNGESSIEKIKEIFTNKGEKKSTLIDLIEYNNQQIKNGLGKGYAIGTLNHYKSFQKKMQDFMKEVFNKQDFNLSDLDMSFITKFEYYMNVTCQNQINTIAKEMSRLKKIIHLGVCHNWLTSDPFKNYKKKTVDPNRESLTQLEIDVLSDLDLTGHLERVRDIFIFICYSGLSYSDLAKLSSGNIITAVDGNKIIHVERKKTFEVCNIPLLPRSEQILTKYNNHPICQNKGILLPVISNQKMNDYLKTIGEKANINKPITCHVGRHTFATLSLEMGVPIETVSKVLGHKSIKTTQIYGKVTNSKIAKDYSQFYVQAYDIKKRV
jgi:site-specific recombinase XerD